MRFTAAKWIMTVVLSTVAFGTASMSSKAEACCGFFRSLFGCGGCGYGSYYGPVGWRGCSTCAPSCSPCGAPCSPCGGVACAPCDSGNCSTTAPGALTPIPNDKWQKKTYADPAPGDAGSGLGDPGRPEKRTKPDSRSNDSDRPNELQDEDESGLQPVNPAGDSGASATGSGSATKSKTPASSKGTKKGPNAPRIDDDNPESGKVPTIRLDEKVAWRSAPTRTRIEARTHAASARLVRLPAYPASDWLPVDSESKVARRK